MVPKLLAVAPWGIVETATGNHGVPMKNTSSYTMFKNVAAANGPVDQTNASKKMEITVAGR